VILLRDLCGICRCLHRIARADRGQERQKQRAKQRKGPYVTEREGEMDSEMEISGLVSSGIAPVISVKTFLPETSVMAGTDMEEEDLYTRQKLLQRQPRASETILFCGASSSFECVSGYSASGSRFQHFSSIAVGEAGCDVQRMSLPLSKL